LILVESLVRRRTVVDAGAMQPILSVTATNEPAACAYAIDEMLAPTGSSPPLHVHHREDEGLWVLEGELTVRRGDETMRALPGTFTYLPRDVPHTYVVEGDAPAVLLTIWSPSGLEQLYAAVGDRPDPETLSRIGAEFGLEVVGSPLTPRASR
jgi:mannose-6-phosphate isomerase-like protein (cupin superfamily)